MDNKKESRTKGNRIYFLDNLRTIIVFLVVLYHAGGVYESSGFWASFWIVDDPATNDLVGILNLVLDIFLMSTMFFISGYLTPMSLKNKDAWVFLKARFKRLMLPWMVAVLTLIPLYKVIFLSSRNMPQENWGSYFHFSNGFISQSWLWFLPVLFLFDVLYVLLSSLNWLPARISLKFAIAATFFIGFVTNFSMDIFEARGWTLTALIDFQNERLLVYFMIFLLGSLCFRQNVFASKPKSKKLFVVANSTSWIPITIYVIFLLFPLINPGSFIISPVMDRLILWLGFSFSLLCLLYLSIETFWRYVDKPGKIWNELNRNAYYVYIIHLIVMGGIALALLETTISSLEKFLVLTVLTYVASNLMVFLHRKALIQITST